MSRFFVEGTLQGMNQSRTPSQTAPTLTAERLKGLSDGVASIVLTLLVLGVEVPEGHDFSKQGLLVFLAKAEYQLTVYAVSFVLIGGYWLQHNVMFHYFSRTTRGMTWLNLLFLFWLTLLPFTTQLIGSYRYEPRVIVIYGGVNIACCLSLAWLWWTGNREPEVVLPRIESDVVRSMLRRILLGVAFSVVAVLVAFVNVRLSHACFLLIPFLQLSHRNVDEHWAELQDEALTAPTPHP